MARKGLSPTQRTLRVLRQSGVIADIVERFNQYAGPFGTRNDMFGFGDLIAIDPTEGIVAIQCCARSGHAAHRTKILENEIAPEWLKAGGKIAIWSWAKQKKERGSKLLIWKEKVEWITIAHFNRRRSA